MLGDLIKQVQIAPSILSADFARLGEQVDEVISAGARVIHVDVMDGHFVPPITFGPVVVAALKERVEQAGAILDVHLMIERPERQVAEFAKAGADLITVHAEATPHLNYTLQQIRDAGCGAGLAVCPGTPVDVFGEIGDLIDLALCMSVNPGWGGQRFIASSEGKLKRMKQLLGPDTALQVDGGVDIKTASTCVAAGSNLLVAGSAVFGSKDPAAAFKQLTEQIL